MSLDDDYADDVRGSVQPHRGVLILVLGLLAVMGVCTLLGIFAWVMGKRDLERIRSGQMDKEGEALTKAGYILGIVGSIFFILQILFVAVYVIVIAAVIASKK